MLVLPWVCMYLTEYVSAFFWDALMLWIIYFDVFYVTIEILEDRLFSRTLVLQMRKLTLRKAIWFVQGDI